MNVIDLNKITRMLIDDVLDTGASHTETNVTAIHESIHIHGISLSQIHDSTVSELKQLGCYWDDFAGCWAVDL